VGERDRGMAGCMRAEKKDRGWGLECRAGGCSMHARLVAVRAEDGGIGRILLLLPPSIAAIEATAPAPIPHSRTLPASRSLDVMRPETSVLRRRPHCCVCALLQPLGGRQPTSTSSSNCSRCSQPAAAAACWCYSIACCFSFGRPPQS